MLAMRHPRLCRAAGKDKARDKHDRHQPHARRVRIHLAGQRQRVCVRP